MDSEQIKFLESVARQDPLGATSTQVPFADRKQDKVRQKCRKRGWVEFVDKGLGRRWHITAAGKVALTGQNSGANNG